MPITLKQLIRPLVPAGARRWLNDRRNGHEERRVRAVQRIFDDTREQGRWLGRDDLERLCLEFPFPPPYGYDPAAVEQRGRERAAALLSALPDTGMNEFLDLACYDGMTAAALQGRGKRSHGVDLEAGGFDARAIAAGVELQVMDASALAFPDGRFDVVYSYNAFEHFTDPTAVLEEALRVTRPGGYVHLHFGPLYASAKGMHAYDRIPVPYCQFLFPLPVLNAYLHANGHRPLDPAHCNQWPVRRFRELWSSARDRAEIITQAEHRHTKDLALVERFPACFKGKVQHFEDLLVNNLLVVLRKRGG
ncbi:MAG: class I SAM-dependent methyltransferase [Bacteroidetes bacterium]|nr:class I SAM-dependent methyltransferase [Bacteroidota bacterium]